MNRISWIRFLRIGLALTFVLAPATNRPIAVAPQVSIAGQASASMESVPTDQIIVKYKAGVQLDGLQSPAGQVRMAQLSLAAGVKLTYVRPMSGDAHVVKLPERQPVNEVQLYADRMVQLDAVEYADPDRVMQPTLMPNDPSFGSQWDFFGPYGINAPAAWDITTGSSNSVVAVIDTGYRPHVDLAGRFLPGYDFIGDVPTANDGNGRDGDASDPGDWITSAESSTVGGPFYGCGVRDSSWHGTHVAGTISASGNNGGGVAGVNWISPLLPVRVLGKCGGYDSDVIDGIRWAAGLAVTGVPTNPNPAKVLNLSLGGPGACDTTMQTAIDAVTAAGATVVIAAGNGITDAINYSPGNCIGVITVAATDANGNLASYSNYGNVVEISAPGGTTSAAGSGVLSTLNAGTTVPTADNYAYRAGTSMAASHVAGVASLLYSLAPTLTPTQVQQIIQDTATTFPSGSTCNISICGTGIVNAANAVSQMPRISSLDPVSATIGGLTFTFVITGANFPADSVVNWNGIPRTTGFIDSTQLTVTVSADDLITSSLASLTVSGTHPTVGLLTTAARTFPIYNASFGPRIYLPLITKPSPTPGIPTLNAVDNADGDGIYAVAWTSVTWAESYTLQEDDNAAYASPTAVYTGTHLTWSASGKAPGTYYYRVRATNTWGSSSWSAPQSVVVPSPGPTPGYWVGLYEDFYVASDRTHVLNFSTYLYVNGCGNYKVTHGASETIVANHFSFGGSFYASGTFNSMTTVSGTDGLSKYAIPGCGTITSGPWPWNTTWQNSAQPSVMAILVKPDGTARLTTVTVTHAFHRVDH